MEPQHVEKAEYVSEKAVGSLRDVLEKATFSVLDEIHVMKARGFHV